MAKYKARTEYQVRWESEGAATGPHIKVFTTEPIARLFALGVASGATADVPKLKYNRQVELFEVDIMETMLNRYNKATAEAFLNPPRISQILPEIDND